jgi:hypothetical protein
VEAYRRDVRPGCADHISATPTGRQKVSFLREIPLDGLGRSGIATAARIIVRGAPTLHASASILYKGNRLSVLVVLSEDPELLGLAPLKTTSVA